MRKLEGAALKKTMAELKKGKNAEITMVKNRGTALKRKAGVKKKGKDVKIMDKVTVNGKVERKAQDDAVPNLKEESNGGAKLMEDESDPYCPDFDEEPALLPLIGRKLNLKPVLNSVDNGHIPEFLPVLQSDHPQINGQITENNDIQEEGTLGSLQHGELDHNITETTPGKKAKKKKVKQPSPSGVNGIEESKDKLNESSDYSAEKVESCSPPKKRKKEKPSIVCEKCEKSFSSEKLYTRHMKLCQLDEEERNKILRHKCSECEYRSAKKAMVTRHLESHGIFKCTKCNFVGSSKEAYRQHNQAEHKERADLKLCRVCSRYIKCDTITLEEHMSTCQGKVPLFCPECKKEFKYESSLRCHLNSHYPDRPKKFSCELCDYKSNYKANLLKHLTCMHSGREQNLKCDQCEAMFYSEKAMQRHSKVHVKHKCKKCSFTCQSLSELKSHNLKTHKPKRRYICSFNDCEEECETPALLKKHEQIVHNVPIERFHCPVKGCNQSFLKRTHVRRHETTHSGERKYRCEWEGCGKAFRHADNLKVHIRQHTNENPVECQLCDFRCKQKSSLRWHMSRKHPEPKPEAGKGIDVHDQTEPMIDAQDDAQEDAAFWQAVIAVIGRDGEGLDNAKKEASSIALPNLAKSGSKKKKKSLSLKKKGKSNKSSKKKKKNSADIKVESGVLANDLEKTKTKVKTCKSKSKSKSKKSKTNASTENKDGIENCNNPISDTLPVDETVASDVVKSSSTNKKSPVKSKETPKGKKLSKSKACKVAKRKGKGVAKKKKIASRGKKSAEKTSTEQASNANLEGAVDAFEEESNVLENLGKRKRNKGKMDDDKAPNNVKKPKRTPPKKAPKKSPKGRKASPKSKGKKKVTRGKQKKTPVKVKETETEVDKEEEQVEASLNLNPESNLTHEEAIPDRESCEAVVIDEKIQENGTEDNDSDSDLWGNNEDPNNEEPDRNCDADDERDLDNDDDVDKMSEKGFLGEQPSGRNDNVDDDAKSEASEGNNSVSDVAFLDDAIPDTPPRAPMRVDDTQEEVDENDYYQPPPSPPPNPINSVDQASVERQDSDQTVLDNSLPHSNIASTPQDVLSEEAVVQDSIKTMEQDGTPTYVRTPQSQPPETLQPNDKDYFGQYLQDLPAVEAPPSVPAVSQDGSPENLSYQIPSGTVERTSEEIKALDLRPEPVSTITHTRLQRETVTGLPNANIERETVSTITHTSRTVQPIVTQPSCIPMPGMQTDVMSYQRMELLACGRPDNIMQPKESSLQRLTSITYQNFGSLDGVNPTCRDMNYLRPAENMFPRSCATGGGFMRVTDGEASLGRAGMNSLLRQPDSSFARPETSLTRATNPSLLRPGTEDLFGRDAMGRPVSRSPFHGAWTGQDIRPAHWNQNPYLQRSVDRSANSATPALLGPDRDFTFDPSRTIPDQNVFSNLTSQQHELPRDTPFQLERFDLSSYFGHPYSTTPALEYGHPTCGANQKAFEDRLRQPSGVPDLRGLPQPPSTEMLNQFCGINVNPSFNLDKYMYARDPVYRPQHMAGTSDSAFLSHTAPSQPTYFSRDYTGRTLYPQSSPYALMDERQYSSASKLSHPAGVQQERDIMGRRTTNTDNQIQDPYRRSVIYNVMNRF